MENADWRRKKGKLLKRRFNDLWEEARAKNAGSLTPSDMERIANLMRIEGRQILDGERLPESVNNALQESIEILNPHKKSLHETIRITLWACAGLTLLAIITLPLGAAFDAGVLKAIANSWSGKSTGGIWGHVGALAGAVTLVFMMWKVSRKITPQHRAVQCQSLVIGAIKDWAGNSDARNS